MKYRVWNIINLPREADYYEVENPVEGLKLIDKLTEKELKDKQVSSNAFGLEEFVAGEWTEWYDEDGEDILHVEFEDYVSPYN